jgi:single-strand DNA-binding protein
MATSFKLTGMLYTVFPEQVVSEKFRKQEFVLKIEGDKFPNFPKFQAVNERIDLLQSFTPGDELTVTFDIQGKEYPKGNETLYFTSLNAWKLEGNAAPKAQSGKPMAKVADLPKETAQTEEDKDQLPF